MVAELPDPFRFEDGRRVRSVADWKRRVDEMRELVVGIEYGGLPATPEKTRCEVLHTATVERFGEARFITCRVVTGLEASFILYLLVPEGDGPFSVVLNGDGCWRYLTDEITAEVVRRGNILAQFNRVEIAPDMAEVDAAPGALAAWAWGYHRCVDVLVEMDFVDAAHIAITGHSRGGKTTLLAGATDERIALTCANDSGCGGAGSHILQGPKCERLEDILRGFPHWFGPRLKEFVNREAELPFDQHFLEALIAPRALLTTEALGDFWANPMGTRQIHVAAREVYRFLGADERKGIWYREGGHEHGMADWRAFLDFVDWQFRGVAPEREFDANPFPELPKGFSWSAPG